MRGLSFSASEHETVALMGPNGAGKTTFLNILATLTAPEAGIVTYYGLPSKGNESEIRRRLGIVSHQLMLYADLTAEENLQFYAKMYTLQKSEQRIDEIFELVHLNKQRRQVVRTLSRGMQQRLAIGRALLHDPQILFLDEPFTGLDAAAAERMIELLQKVVSQEKTVVMVSHSFKEVSLLANRALLLQSGSFVQSLTLAGWDEQKLAEQYRAVIRSGE